MCVLTDGGPGARVAASVSPQKLKLRYYRLMVEYGNHEEQYLDVSKNYRRIYDTPSIQADEDQWSRVLRGAVIYAVLAPYDNEQSDVVHRLAKDKNLDKLPVTRSVCMRSEGRARCYGEVLGRGARARPGVRRGRG